MPHESDAARATRRRQHARRMARVNRPCPVCGRLMRPSNIERHVNSAHRRRK